MNHDMALIADGHSIGSF